MAGRGRRDELGIYAFYLALLIGPTYYLKRRIGVVRWRVLHRISLVVYILSLMHTLLLGRDFWEFAWVRQLTWLAQIPLLALFIYRLARPAKPPRQPWITHLRHILIGLSAAAIAGIVVLVGTAHATWPPRVGNTGAHPPTETALAPWLGVTAALVLAVVAITHARHTVHNDRAGKAWHAAHIAMAIGMIAMFLPGVNTVIPAWAGQLAFGVAAVGAGGICLRKLLSETDSWVIWLLMTIDLAAMTYMYALPAPGLVWLTVAITVWLFGQAAGLGTGHLAALTALTNRDHRVALITMSLAMAYMLIAMQFGAAHAGHVHG